MAIARLRKFPEGGGYLRLWNNDSAAYDSLFDFTYAAEFDSKFNKIILHGIANILSPPQHQAIIEVARTSGFDFIEFEIIINGEIRQIVKKLKLK